MDTRFFERPILNSPYASPARHWELDAQGQPTGEIIETRRTAQFKRRAGHYETQSDEEAVAEDEAAYEATTSTAMEVPVDLVPVVRELIAKRSAG
jgi:hypothetical protein